MDRLKAGLARGLVALATGIFTFTPLGASAALDPYLQTAMTAIVAAGYPGAYVVEANGSTTGTGAAGVADISTNRPAQPHLAMRVGSVTKSFVATVVLQLAGEGKLSLDDTVEHWEPGLLPYGDQVTVRMLLNHTSGVPDYLEFGPDPQVYHFINDPAFRNRTWTPRQIVNLVNTLPPNFTPGTAEGYSDTNFIIAGMIVRAAATSHSVVAEINNRIIGPLGLTRTSFPLTSQAIPGANTRGYSFLTDPITHLPIPGTLTDETNYNPSLFWATGAIISTPADLNKFYRALLGGQLLSPSLLAQMKQTVPVTEPNFPPGVGFGLGIWSWTLPCGQTIWGHEGEVPGFNTYSFSSEDGTRNITMEVNQLKATGDMFFAAFAGYVSLWCRQ